MYSNNIFTVLLNHCFKLVSRDQKDSDDLKLVIFFFINSPVERFSKTSIRENVLLNASISKRRIINAIISNC